MSIRASDRMFFAFVVLFTVVLTAQAGPPPMTVEATFRQPDGMILIAGRASSGTLPRSIVVARLYPSGQWDPGFANGGSTEYPVWQAMTELRVTAVTAQPDGKILVASQIDGRLALLRFEMAGAPDATFGTSGSGMQIDYDTDAIRVNAIYVHASGNILGVGSYTPAGGSPTAAAVRHFQSGMRDGTFGSGPGGVKTYPMTATESELRAIMPTANGYVATGNGRESPTSFRKMLIAGFLADGQTDYSFGSGGWSLYEMNWGGDAEAVSIRADATGGFLVAGGNGHNFNGPQSWLTLAPFSNTGQPDYNAFPGPMGQVPIPSPFDGDATAVSVEPIPGSADYLIAGSVTERATGRSHFAIWRLDRDSQEPYAWGPFATPIAIEDDVMAAAFVTPDGQILAVGTRESMQGDTVVRMRYFADNGEFDTVISDGADTTPNPFAFGPYGVRVGSGLQAATQPVRISGISAATPITVTGGQYVLNCDYFGAWTSDPGYIYNGQKICVRVTAATTPDTTRTVTLNVGGVEAGFSLTTGFVPDTFIHSKPTNPGISTAYFYYFRDMVSAGDTTYECRLDAAPFTSCPANGITYTGLALGSHTFAVRAANEWGQDQTPASYSWTVADLPQTNVDSAPAYYINVTSATVTFSSPDAGTNFQCRLNSAAYASCTSPKTYTGLVPGGYIFDVRAVNAVGTDPSPAQAQWIIDTTPPDTMITSGPSPGTPYGVRSLEFVLSSNDPSAHFEHSMDGGPFAKSSSPVYLSGLADGNHTFSARAVDPYGNVDATPVSRDFVVEATPPVTSVSGGPSASTLDTTASFTLGPQGSGFSFECTLDGVATPCASTSPVQFTGLSEGTHVFTATVKRLVRDANDNTIYLADPTPETRTWAVDLTSPETTITTGPSGTVSQNLATFNFSSSESGGTFECSLDSAPFVACQSGVGYAGLAEGTHMFQVRARDVAGQLDSTPATRSWAVDSTSPNTTISTGPNALTASMSATFTFSSSEGASAFLCSIDGAANTVCSSPTTYSGLAGGAHTFSVFATDAAGNPDPSPANWSWVIDLNPPDTTITSGPATNTTATSATFQFSAPDAVSFECARDGGAFASCASPKSYSSLSTGAHTFQVRGRDALGNLEVSPATWGWNIDITAPNTTIISGPAGTVTSTTATFAFDSSESGSTFACKLDGGAFVACASPKTYTGLPKGNRTFQVRASDAAGNVDATPASRNWKIN